MASGKQTRQNLKEAKRILSEITLTMRPSEVKANILRALEKLNGPEFARTERKWHEFISALSGYRDVLAFPTFQPLLKKAGVTIQASERKSFGTRHPSTRRISVTSYLVRACQDNLPVSINELLKLAGWEPKRLASILSNISGKPPEGLTPEFLERLKKQRFKERHTSFNPERFTPKRFTLSKRRLV